ncbi:hypothetical protein Save01_09158 [Streptomyces avermitilis]
MVQRLAQCHQRRLRRHRRQTPTPHLPHGPLRHPPTSPRTPRHRQPRQALTTPVPNDCLHIRVRRRVTPLSRRPERRRSRREHHEPRKIRPPRQLMQIPGRQRLRPQHPRDTLGRQPLQHPVIHNSRGMHHHTQRALRRNGRPQHLRQRLTVRRITRHHRHPRAQAHQVRSEFFDSLGALPASAHQQQVFGATPGHPPGDVRTQLAGASGDEYGAAGPPLPLRDGLLQRRPHQPPHKRPRRPHGKLTLTPSPHTRQHTYQPIDHPLIHELRHINQPTPAVRCLRPHHTAQPPHHTRGRPPHSIPAPHRHGPARHTPQPRPHAHITQRLHQPHRRHSRLHDATPPAHKGDDTADSLTIDRLTQVAGQHFPAHTPRFHLHPNHSRPTPLQPLRHHINRARLALGHHQPRARQPPYTTARNGSPHLPIAPPVHHFTLVPYPPPFPQRRHHRTQRRPLIHPKERCHHPRITTLDRLPQRTTPHPGNPGTSRRSLLHVQPKSLPLKRIRRQLHPASITDLASSPLEHTGPLNRRPSHEQLRQGGHDRPCLRLVRPQGRDGAGRCTERVLCEGRQRAVGADFEAGGDALFLKP